jgi:hypothetical protein
LWRLRRATAIEAGLFEIQARQLLQFRQGRPTHHERQKIIDSMYRNATATEDGLQLNSEADPVSPSPVDSPNRFDDLTRSFVRLANLPSYPLDRLSRYEAALWRQACQILFTLQCLDRRKPWEAMRIRSLRCGP